ncbi:hypothetical protein BMS3Bbin04_00506 [bacterium BMS3Bbin04]|nr:hypothetical protein BMS3Bbin04_00506 [bacterium BMS3Bbin04]
MSCFDNEGTARSFTFDLHLARVGSANAVDQDDAVCNATDIYISGYQKVNCEILHFVQDDVKYTAPGSIIAPWGRYSRQCAIQPVSIARQNGMGNELTGRPRGA